MMKLTCVSSQRPIPIDNLQCSITSMRRYPFERFLATTTTWAPSCAQYQPATHITSCIIVKLMQLHTPSRSTALHTIICLTCDRIYHAYLAADCCFFRRSGNPSAMSQSLPQIFDVDMLFSQYEVRYAESCISAGCNACLRLGRYDYWPWSQERRHSAHTKLRCLEVLRWSYIDNADFSLRLGESG
jgi:hypothetical protein